MANVIRLFPKQAEFFALNNRINVYVAGIQSAKTTTGSLKMLYEGVLKNQRPDANFIIASDTYKTLSQATIPSFMKFAKPFGTLNRQAGEFKTHWGSTIYLRTATDPESMEGITNVYRVWLDEAGKISRYFFENAMGRAAFKQAPIDITTTPYSMNWLADLCKEAREGKRSDVSMVQCRSIDSPYFPREEYERQKTLLDPRRFAMKYEGQFGKMEGLVYDHINLCKSFPLPSGTRYFGEIDWGYSPDPFCFVIRAVTPDNKHYRVFEYYRNFLTISDIVDVVRNFNNLYHLEMTYCDPSQPAHIEELNRAGVPAMGSNNDIRYGIDKHYELIKTDRFWIFEDMCPIGIDEYNAYHYPEPSELSFDQGSRKKDQLPVDKDNHGCDADRYASVMILDGITQKRSPKAPHDNQRPKDLAKRLDWLKRGGASRSSY
jgi:PBSX family phage terminase large subunit